MKKSMLFIIVIALTLIVMMMAACTSPAQPVVEQPATEEPPLAEPCKDLGLPGEMAGKCWEDILKEAEGQTITYYHWGGSDLYNRLWFVDLGERLAEFGVKIITVPVASPGVFVDKIVNEVASGVDVGSVDLVWINGENFRTVKEIDALYGPYSDKLPNSIYYDWSQPSYQFDKGTPVEGMESPESESTFIWHYNTSCVSESELPKTYEELKQWIMDNPGKFTYTAPPEFTARDFVAPLFYALTGGYEQWVGDVDAEMIEKFTEEMQVVWDWLNEVEPYLWREGKTYPEQLIHLDDLFANGEICFGYNVFPGFAEMMVKEGRFPETIGTFVLEDGTATGNSYVAIPKNSGNIAGALVAANIIMGPEWQLHAFQPDTVASLPALTMSLLPEEWIAKFDAVPRAEYTMMKDEFEQYTVPNFTGGLIPIFERLWEENVLKK